jgi:hypothetical protein
MVFGLGAGRDPPFAILVQHSLNSNPIKKKGDFKTSI